MILTADQLAKLVPLIKPSAVSTFLPHLQRLMPQYGIDTAPRIGGFIAQTAEESINFSYVLERDSGKKYEMRADLGNNVMGDGVKFRGRGIIQITGKTMYQAVSLELFNDERLLLTPELLTAPQYAVQSACWFWKKKGLNLVADEPEDYVKAGPHQYSKLQWMTVLINGGLNGIVERTANYQRARQVLNF